MRLPGSVNDRLVGILSVDANLYVSKARQYARLLEGEPQEDGSLPGRKKLSMRNKASAEITIRFVDFLSTPYATIVTWKS